VLIPLEIGHSYYHYIRECIYNDKIGTYYQHRYYKCKNKLFVIFKVNLKSIFFINNFPMLCLTYSYKHTKL